MALKGLFNVFQTYGKEGPFVMLLLLLSYCNVGFRFMVPNS